VELRRQALVVGFEFQAGRRGKANTNIDVIDPSFKWKALSAAYDAGVGKGREATGKGRSVGLLS